MRRALVLSGGGAKGSWQVGACQHLIVERGLWFDVIAGVSAGAVNAAVLASCALPLIFPPVPLGDGHELGVDGGLQRVTPLVDALRVLAEGRAPGDEPDEVWVLAPHAAGPIARPPLHNWLWVALRSISVLTSVPVSASGEPPGDNSGTPSAITLRVLRPREQLRGPSLSCHPRKVRAWYEDGLDTARREADAAELPLEPELQHDAPP